MQNKIILQRGAKMLKTGKLDSELLQKIVFEHITYRRPEVLTRPGIGEDCAVVDFEPYECVLSTDPITAAIHEIGRLAVHISCNDIASNGIEPLGIMLAVMLPEGTTEDEIEEMMKQAGEASASLGVEIIGGHTEITSAVNQPVIVSTAIGRGWKNQSQKASDMKPGDWILMTKEAGMEGAGILASDFAEELKGTLTEAELREAKDMLLRVSVVQEGVIAGKIGTAGMHDVTEGGILGAIWELCSITKTGVEVWEEAIPVSPITKKICERFQLDYLRLISSGSMIMIVEPDKKVQIESALQSANIQVACIGKVCEQGMGMNLLRDREKIEIMPPGADELYRAFSERK